jgi:hypothetical protein
MVVNIENLDWVETPNAVKEVGENILQYSRKNQEKIIKDLLEYISAHSTYGQGPISVSAYLAAKKLIKKWECKDPIFAVTQQYAVLLGSFSVFGREFGYDDLPSKNEAFQKIFPEPEGRKIEAHVWSTEIDQIFGVYADLRLCTSEEALSSYEKKKEEVGDYDYDNNPGGIEPPKPFANGEYMWTDGYGDAVWTPKHKAENGAIEHGYGNDYFVLGFDGLDIEMPEDVHVRDGPPPGYTYFSFKDCNEDSGSMAGVMVARAIMNRGQKPAVHLHGWAGNHVNFIGWK